MTAVTAIEKVKLEKKRKQDEDILEKKLNEKGGWQKANKNVAEVVTVEHLERWKFIIEWMSVFAVYEGFGFLENDLFLEIIWGET